MSVVVAIIIGLVLYTIRCRRLFWYGLLELVVALVVIFLTFYPQLPPYVTVDT
jgi:hypothetical protein